MSVHGIAVRIEKLNKSFGGNHVLKDIDLDIAPGETFSIIGPSGTGKSILLRHIIRLETPDSGQIYFNGQPVFDNGRPLPQTFRSSMVFQSSALFNSLTVAENVGLWRGSTASAPRRASASLLRRSSPSSGWKVRKG
ncbi:ATP-binding cassette domain-containing protein [Geobacter sp. FeAm09]|uniref:ATP-binding cassette domain-containing protein n=1 Tax=Geobacter sp. FeAm09 TaxID=2597769 RepID=UPI002106B51C|nr:ATP-binding cassette domain-containing protein [Geobacter sp. FeAm09]